MFLDTLDDLRKAREDDINAWFAEQERGKLPPFYASVDIRHAGYKAAVVDTNLFPAGFNNLCEYSNRLGAEQVQAYFSKHFPEVKRVLIIPESNTRNPGYTARLRDIIAGAGKEVVVGTLIESVPSAGAELQGLEDTKVLLKPFQVNEGVPEVDGKPFDAVLLNHDLSGGEPPIIRQITVPVIPRRVLGWHRRRKSRHFAKLYDITTAFAEAFQIDPWLIHAETEFVPNVRFDQPDPNLRAAVERMLGRTGAAFARYNVTETPYVFIKHDAGTYGIGVMPIHDLSELDNLSRDAQKKMQRGKGGVEITDVIVQEGLPTRDKVKESYGEPVVYAMNNHIIGGFFRIHSEADERISLNKPGQIFAKLCSTPSREQSRDAKCYHDTHLFCTYGILARLAGLAVMAERDELEQLA
jgi:glutamate--cysteine ligase